MERTIYKSWSRGVGAVSNICSQTTYEVQTIQPNKLLEHDHPDIKNLKTTQIYMLYSIHVTIFMLPKRLGCYTIIIVCSIFVSFPEALYRLYFQVFHLSVFPRKVYYLVILGTKMCIKVWGMNRNELMRFEDFKIKVRVWPNIGKEVL